MGLPPHISLSCPNIHNGDMHIFYKRTASTYSFFPLPLMDGTIQPSLLICHTLALSLVTKPHVPQHIPGIHGVLLPLPCQDGSPRGLCSLLNGPHVMHSLDSSVLGQQPFDFCQHRAEVPLTGEKNQMELITCPSRVSICVSDEMWSKRAPTHSNFTLPRSHISTLWLWCSRCWRGRWESCACLFPFVAEHLLP